MFDHWIVQDLCLIYKQYVKYELRIVIVVGTVESVERNKKALYVGYPVTPPSGCSACCHYLNQLALWRESA